MQQPEISANRPLSSNLTPHNPHLEHICDRLVSAINTALRNDRRLDDHRVAVNPSTEYRMVVYWRTRPRRWEVRRFRRIVRREMRHLLKADGSIRPGHLYHIAPNYVPRRYGTTTNANPAEGTVYSSSP